MLFREHFLSDVLPHLHNNNDNAHKLFSPLPRTQPSLYSSLAISKSVYRAISKQVFNNVFFNPLDINFSYQWHIPMRYTTKQEANFETSSPSMAYTQLAW